MLRTRPLIASVTALLAASFVAAADCQAALAAKLGLPPRYTGRLSSNKAVRKQQLIVDPEGILGGSVSVRYDTRVVRFVGVIDPAEFEVTGGFVGVLPKGGITKDLVPLETFLDAFSGITRRLADDAREDPSAAPGDPDAGEFFEQGYVQIFFNRRSDDAAARDAGVSTIPNLPGYTTVAEDGRTGVGDTHALLFEYRDGVLDGTRAEYSIFATGPRDGTVSDSLTSADQPERPVPYTDLLGARVSGSLDYAQSPPPAVPLPPAAAAGLLALGALAGGMAWRRARRGCRPT